MAKRKANNNGEEKCLRPKVIIIIRLFFSALFTLNGGFVNMLQKREEKLWKFPVHLMGCEIRGKVQRIEIKALGIGELNKK